jgi:hypothetical protein
VKQQNGGCMKSVYGFSFDGNHKCIFRGRHVKFSVGVYHQSTHLQIYFGILNVSYKHVVVNVDDDDAKFEVIFGKFNIHRICVK